MPDDLRAPVQAVLKPSPASSSSGIPFTSFVRIVVVVALVENVLGVAVPADGHPEHLGAANDRNVHRQYW